MYGNATYWCSYFIRIVIVNTETHILWLFSFHCVLMFKTSKTFLHISPMFLCLWHSFLKNYMFSLETTLVVSFLYSVSKCVCMRVCVCNYVCMHACMYVKISSPTSHRSSLLILLTIYYLALHCRWHLFFFLIITNICVT